MALKVVTMVCTLASVGMLQSCRTELPAVPEADTVRSNVVVGRAMAVITGERSRMYEPAVRSFEIPNRQTEERLTVQMDSDNERFLLPLVPGDYELIRVQISEGPFMSVAQLNFQFSVGAAQVTYLGMWRFGVDSHKYGRMISISIASDDETVPRLYNGLV